MPASIGLGRGPQLASPSECGSKGNETTRSDYAKARNNNRSYYSHSIISNDGSSLICKHNFSDLTDKCRRVYPPQFFSLEFTQKFEPLAVLAIPPSIGVNRLIRAACVAKTAMPALMRRSFKIPSEIRNALIRSWQTPHGIRGQMQRSATLALKQPSDLLEALVSRQRTEKSASAAESTEGQNQDDVRTPLRHAFRSRCSASGHPADCRPSARCRHAESPRARRDTDRAASGPGAKDARPAPN